MNNLKEYIIEKFKITKKAGVKYNYHPKTFEELKVLIKELLKERGPNADLNDIDTYGIISFHNHTNHTGLFEGMNIENIDISQWDVSNVTDMKYTFLHCHKFNCDLSSWDVSRVTNMDGMFNGCENFEGKGLENWKVSKVENMQYMFAYSNFNQDISSWDVSNVESMQAMFKKDKKFNQDLEAWTVQANVNTFQMFFDCSSLKKTPSWT